MSQWEMVKLGDVCSLLNGYAFKSENYTSSGIRVIRITNVQKGRIEDNSPQFYPTSAIDEIERYLLKSGDLLISLTGNVGRAGILTANFLPAALNQRVACLRVNNINVLQEYLFHIINSDQFENDCIKNSNGVAQKNLSTNYLKDYLIPLPPLDIQKQIVARLELAQALIDQRKQQVGLMDTLIQSTFYEMFGDPVKNEKMWEIKPLSLLSKKITDGTHQSPNWADNGYPFIFVSNIRNHEIDFNTSKFVSQEEAIRLHKGCKIEIGDVLLTVVGSYGYSARVKDSNIFAFQRHIAHVKPLPSLIDSVFLERLLSSLEIKGYIDNVVTGIAQKTLTLSELKKLPTIAPPLPLQQQFAERVQKIETLKSQMTKSLTELEQSFSALMQQSFSE